MIWIARPRSRTKNSPIHTNPDCKHINDSMAEYPDSQIEVLDRRICNNCKGETEHEGKANQPGWEFYRAAVNGEL